MSSVMRRRRYLTLPILFFALVAAALAQPRAAPALVELDVPFVVSPPAVTLAMLEMAKVTTTDFVIDLGSGDGRIVILAASRYGARGLGVEIDPALVALARANAEKAKVANRAEFRVQDLFETDLRNASVITMYLLPDVNIALRPKLLALKPGTRITSHDWNMGDWEADEMRIVDHPEKTLGLEKISRVYLWIVPANIHGKWCATDTSGAQATNRAVTLDIAQQYQKLQGVLSSEDRNQRRRNEQGLNMREVRFRATMQGSQFAIPHGSADATARVEGETILLDGRSYGLSPNLTFRRAAANATTCGDTLKTIAAQP
jgi:SAM-dependent methyltransferase